MALAASLRVLSPAQPIRSTLPTCSLLLLLGACGSPDPSEAIQFADPSAYRVRPGDTLSSICHKEGIALADLMAWNGLESDRIEVDQHLYYWPSKNPIAVEPPPRAASATAAPRPRGRPPPKRSRPASVRATESGQRPVVVMAPVVVEAPTYVRQAVEVDAARSVKTAGILSALGSTEVLTDGLDAGLSETVHQLEHRPRTERSTGSQSQSLQHAGTAESIALHVAARAKAGPHVPDLPVRPPALTRPPARRCLDEPTAADLSSDRGYLTSEGLTADQIRGVMSGFVQHTMHCIPKGTRGTFSFAAEITVGCDGRVADVQVARDGGLPARVSRCISQTLAFASFPAHALPDGMAFQYPIKYRY